VATTGTHKDLLVWTESLGLAEMVYKQTGRFPQEERFGLSAQMRRAAVSVASNIAEGAARPSVREFCRYLGVARGSLAELETQMILSQRLGLLRGSTLGTRIERVGQLLSALHRAMRAKLKDG
jgi:four helix bundle protein